MDMTVHSERLDSGRIGLWLSAEDLKLAEYMAHKRNVNEKHFGPRLWGSRVVSSHWVHLQGAMGEIAVARYYGVEPDLVFMERGGGGDADNEIRGYSVEVKTRPFYRPLNLMVAVDKFRGADVYICCCCEPPSDYVEIVGWATGKEVSSKEPRHFLPGLPLSYIIPEWELRRLRVEEESQR